MADADAAAARAAVPAADRPGRAELDAAFARRARTTGLAWFALVALMLASLGSAYLKLGALNMVAGLVIAAIKSAIVVWLFMRMRECGPLIRLAALVGLGVWAVQVALTGVDYETRTQTPAAVQRPEQLLVVPRGASSPAASPNG